MENKDYGIIGMFVILTLAVGGIGLNTFSTEEINNMYTCDVNNETGIFYGGISSTALTAYPYEENTTDYIRCYSTEGAKGQWVKTIDFIDDYNLTINESAIIEINSTLPVNQDPVDDLELFTDVEIESLDNETIIIKWNGKRVIYHSTINELEHEKIIIAENKYFTLTKDGVIYTCENIPNGNCVLRE